MQRNLKDRIYNSFRYRFNDKIAKRYFPYLYCKYLYKEIAGKKTDFSNPRDINEKIQWLEFFTDTTEWSHLADKYAVREYVKERVGEEILIPLLGKWEKTADIDFSILPNKFVIKPNNGSYDCCIVTDKEHTDLEDIRRKMDNSMKHSFGRETSEPHYLRIRPCIIAEQFLETDQVCGLIDYKMWCFHGSFHSVLLCSNRDIAKHRVTFNYYDANWKRYPEYISESFRNDFDISKPKNFDLMIEYAEKLSAGLPQARIDLYNIKGKIYFGEITLTSNFGMMPYYTQEVLDDMGLHCILPELSFREKTYSFFSRWCPKF